MQNSSGSFIHDLTFRRIKDSFLRLWFLIPLFMVLGWLGAIVFLRYEKPTYESFATLRMLEEDNPFRDLKILEFGDQPNQNLQSEMEIIRSRTIVLQAIKTLPLEVSYFLKGRVLTSELYLSSPFEVISDSSTGAFPYEQMFRIQFENNNSFTLFSPGETKGNGTKYISGQQITFNGFKFRIIVSNPAKLLFGETYLFKFNDPMITAMDVKGRLKVEETGFFVNVIKVEYQDFVPEKCRDVVNAICAVYLENDIKRKKQGSDQMIEFVENQLDTISSKVKTKESSIQNFKTEYSVIDITEKGKMELERLQNYEQMANSLQLENTSLRKIRELLNSGQPQDLYKLDLYTLNDPMMSQSLENLRTLLDQRITALGKFTENSPTVKELDIKIDKLRQMLLERGLAYEAIIIEQMQFINGKLSEVKGQIKQLPMQENLFMNIKREYEIQEQIYLKLLEYRAEAAIKRAAIVASAFVVDDAILPSGPIKPDKTYITTSSILLGSLLAMVLILAIGVSQNSIRFAEDVEFITRIPLLGTINQSRKELKTNYPAMVVIDNPRTSFAESMRLIRTNAQFILSQNKGKIISITSSISGEGKSFVSVNLAGIISMTGKKVVIIDCDLRRPKLHLTFRVANEKGMSNYVAGSFTIKEVIHKEVLPNIDFVPSGPVPPNPAELCQSDRLMEMLDAFKKEYDYIIIDNAPVGLVSDSIFILQNSDVNLYIARSGYTQPLLLKIPEQICKDHQIKNLYLILNSVLSRNQRYGDYGQSSKGYYTDFAPERKGLWKLFNRS